MNSMISKDLSKAIKIKYTNWEGKTATRYIIPQKLWYGDTEWAKEDQWLLTAYDLDKRAIRHFELRGLKEWDVKTKNR